MMQGLPGGFDGPFVYFYEQKELKYNLILAATAEEENSGDRGIRSLLSDLPAIDFAVVGSLQQCN